MSSQGREAVRLFDGGGYNCAQAILGAYGPLYGLERETAFRMAAGLGSGTAKTGATCGAVTGAVMVLGLALSSGKPRKILPDKGTVAARKFVKLYTGRVGSVNCNALRGFSPDKPYEKGNNKKCPGFVEAACALLDEMLGLDDKP